MTKVREVIKHLSSLEFKAQVLTFSHRANIYLNQWIKRHGKITELSWNKIEDQIAKTK